MERHRWLRKKTRRQEEAEIFKLGRKRRRKDKGRRRKAKMKLRWLLPEPILKKMKVVRWCVYHRRHGGGLSPEECCAWFMAWCAWCCARIYIYNKHVIYKILYFINKLFYFLFLFIFFIFNFNKTTVR
ncbi:hypothetical protein Bca4012_048693 [Brassica carinata]